MWICSDHGQYEPERILLCLLALVQLYLLKAAFRWCSASLSEKAFSLVCWAKEFVEWAWHGACLYLAKQLNGSLLIPLPKLSFVQGKRRRKQIYAQALNDDALFVRIVQDLGGKEELMRGSSCSFSAEFEAVLKLTAETSACLTDLWNHPVQVCKIWRRSEILMNFPD